MDKQKQMIEEMANIIYERVNTLEHFGLALFGLCEKISEELLKHYQPKIPEGAVVLTEKEYKRFERIEKIIKLAKMERANGYEVKNGKLYYFTNMLEGFEYEFKDLQEICDAANHYNEEFFGLQQRLDFWKVKAETTAKETAEKFAKLADDKSVYFNMDDTIYKVVHFEDIVEICKEITGGMDESL